MQVDFVVVVVVKSSVFSRNSDFIFQTKLILNSSPILLKVYLQNNFVGRNETIIIISIAAGKFPFNQCKTKYSTIYLFASFFKVCHHYLTLLLKHTVKIVFNSIRRLFET